MIIASGVFEYGVLLLLLWIAVSLSAMSWKLTRLLSIIAKTYLAQPTPTPPIPHIPEK